VSESHFQRAVINVDSQSSFIMNVLWSLRRSHNVRIAQSLSRTSIGWRIEWPSPATCRTVLQPLLVGF